MFGIGHIKMWAQELEAHKLLYDLKHFDPEPLVPNDGSTQVIVSLTTYGERLKTVDLAIKSILANTVRPNRIILWLDEQTKGELPRGLVELEEYGVEIRRGVENLQPHKKYFYTMKENPGAIIITVDDDAMYSRDTIASLLEGHRERPNCIIARRVHKITWDIDTEQIDPYQEWGWEWRSSSEPRMDLLATGVGGVLYPPRLLNYERLLDIEAIRSCCLRQDDLWLKVNEVLSGVPVAWARCRRVLPLEIPDTQNSSLNFDNVHKGQNDVNLHSVLHNLGLSDSEFISLLRGQE